MNNSPAWETVEEMFFQALEVPPDRREEWVEETCADPSLASEVKSLLRAHASVEAAEAPGLVGPYRLQRRIGCGGMGEVWLAARQDGHFEQQVAIKFIRAGLGAEVLLPRFRQERQMLAQLNHPNITKLLDGGISRDGRHYLVMEWVDGQPLLDFCRERRLDLRARVELFRTLCAAVEYAHQNLIVHRDLKPGNVLVTAAGSPKLLDFGIAKLIGDSAESTRTAMPLMTVRYASPEQLQGGQISTASDIYSLGVMLFELLTGELPYSAPVNSLPETIAAVTQGEIRRASSVARFRAGDLDAILDKALAKDPRSRYASVERFSADLGKYLAGLPVSARPLTAGYRLRKYVRRYRFHVAAAGMLALSLTGGLAASLWQARIARTERRRAEQRFNDVRALAHSFLFDFNDAIQNLPGATPARHLVVDKGLQYLNSLSRESGNDPALQADLAEAYLRLGQIQGGLGFPNLGDSEGALRSFEHAAALASEGVRRDPQSVAWHLYLARAQTRLGDLLGVRDGPATAIVHYREALRNFDAVAPRIAHDMNAQFELAQTYDSLGDFLGNPGLDNIGDFAGAREAYSKSLAITQSIAAAQPTNLRNRRALGLRLMKLSDVEMGMGNANAALRLYRAAVSSLEALAASNPSDARTRLFLALAVGKIGQALEASGQARAALREYERASDLQRGLMLADPRNEMSRNSYALSLQRQANLLGTLGDRKKAMLRYAEALAIARQLSAADPQNLRRKGLCGELLVAMGALAAAGGDRTGAERFYTQGLPLLKLRADRNGATAADASLYAEQLLTCPIRSLADPAQAAAYERKAMALLPPTSPMRKEIWERLAKLEHASRSH